MSASQQPTTATTSDDSPEVRTMRAIVQDRYGSAEVLRLAQVATPTPAANEVLVRVHAAGLNRGDWHLMTGRPYAIRLATGLRTPRHPVVGHEVAGTVVAVGSAVSSFSVGDQVYGAGKGSFAEYAAARADRLARKPATLTFAQAAVLPTSALTALHALDKAGQVEPGQQVLITGASGGVGSYAVQLAKVFGAEVTGVCSTGKVDLVRSLGADHVIDYTRADFADGSRRYDLIIDIAGNPTVARLRRALAPTGTAVIIGGEEGGNLTGGMNRQLWAMAISPFLRQRLTTAISIENASDLARLTELVESGKLTPALDRTYPLDQAPEAMRRLAAGQARGKLAIDLAIDLGIDAEGR